MNKNEVNKNEVNKNEVNKNEMNKNEMNKNGNKCKIANAIFKVMADIEPDIYNLFIYKDGSEEYYDMAFIPTYKLSVMMNSLFRNIKENNYLDAIEESDDELDFEDKREDKYVYLDKSILMKCEYNYKFKRWTPIEIANKDNKIISFNTLKKIIPK